MVGASTRKERPNEHQQTLPARHGYHQLLRRRHDRGPRLVCRAVRRRGLFPVAEQEAPAYVEFRIGDSEDEFGIIDRRYAPAGMQAGPGGAILLWHVDDLEAAFARLIALGAKEYDPITKRGETGFATASVVDPFGNVLGIMYNPHYVAVLGAAA
jgi:predicted enzyme related to lactoylglutathione lyase